MIMKRYDRRSSRNPESVALREELGYAVFPTIGKGGVVVGGAYGKGRVYEKGKYVGDTSVTQITAGFQLGGEAYSQIIFFENQQAFKEFTSGNFEFGAQAQAVAITAGASAATTTTGTGAGASVTQHDAKNVATSYKGMTNLCGHMADVRSQHRVVVQLQEEANHSFGGRPILRYWQPLRESKQASRARVATSQQRRVIDSCLSLILRRKRPL
jgi:hypothetical protein